MVNMANKMIGTIKTHFASLDNRKIIGHREVPMVGMVMEIKVSTHGTTNFNYVDLGICLESENC